ncbi:MAG: class I tRNA ligase family protein [bacterium]|nr:class I tRNA ligase family protein [bacterium]
MPNKFYITTSIAYVNSKPHIGYALELLQADVLARYHRLVGNEVFFLTGTDEHGAKIAKAAESAGKEPREFTDEISAEFVKLTKKLNISNDDFIRTSDAEKHWPGVFKIWKALKEKGDLYKDTYEGLYCVGHEAFIKKSDLNKDGLCPDHKTEPEKIKEENYFFKLKGYKKDLQKIYEDGHIKIFPETRKNEVLSMLKDSEDISFSRPRKDLKWGIPVPDDDEHTIYVWSDALTNYLSAIGYGKDADWQKWWPADAHVIGKDILRFHAIIWPAMLLSAGLELPKSLAVHGHITVDGEKMSKTVGNIIDPFELVEKYGIDPVRYFLLREIPSTEDGDFSYKKLEDRYNGDLANNLGNLVSRTAKLIETRANGEINFEEKFIDQEAHRKVNEATEAYKKALDSFKLHEALGAVWDLLSYANSFIDLHKPWAADEDSEDLMLTLTTVLGIILNATWFIKPFIPETAEKIFEAFGADLPAEASAQMGDKYETWVGRKFTVQKTEPLFPRISN